MIRDKDDGGGSLAARSFKQRLADRLHDLGETTFESDLSTC